MIELSQFTVQRHTRVICAVDSLVVSRGERVVILGANGSGKTTLLRTLGGLSSPFAGRCEIAVPVTERVYVHQAPLMLSGTVMKNLTYGLRARGSSRSEAEQKVQPFIEQLGLSRIARQSARTLSGGEQRRVAIGRAIAVRPQLLLLDEPFADMDTEGVEAVTSLLTAQTEMTILIASPTRVREGIAMRTFGLEQANSVPSA